MQSLNTQNSGPSLDGGEWICDIQLQGPHPVFLHNLPDPVRLWIGWHALVDDLGDSIEHGPIGQVGVLQDWTRQTISVPLIVRAKLNLLVQ